MTGSVRPYRARIVAAWVVIVLLAAAIVAHAHYVTDLSAFLPARPTPMQRLLVDQLREGPASRTILLAIEGGDPAARAAASGALARRLRDTAFFVSVDNGEPLSAEADRRYLFGHRYVLSEAVDARHFTADGLRAAIADTIDGLASATGLLLKSLVPQDPTGEMLRIVDQLTPADSPRTQDGVWTSADGGRALLVAQTRAAGSDTDAQEGAIDAIRATFTAVPRAATLRLALSGPGVFAVASRAKIKGAAMRLSVISSVLVVVVLLAVYRSIPALVLGLLPVATGAVCGIAAVALGFGVVHGITLGFGITLIGESVDYSIYFFIQSQRGPPDQPGGTTWQSQFWPTIRLGMLTSVCGFASLLPSGFPGLAQLGLYSISGLLAAALVTRFVLPELLPANFAVRDMSGFGRRVAQAIGAVDGHGRAPVIALACVLAIASSCVLLAHRQSLWNRELAALSPISARELAFDAALRADLGSADVLDLVIVTAPDRDSALQGAERAGAALTRLIDAHVIAGFDSPARYLPSLATQRARVGALPEPALLRADLRRATAGLDLDAAQLEPFLADVEAARHSMPIRDSDLEGTSLAGGLNALLLHQRGQWNALLPLHAGTAGGVDVGAVRAALASARLVATEVLDVKAESDGLYSTYLNEAMRLSSAGLGIIVLLLLVALRSIGRVARVMAPLLLAVLSVAAVLVLAGQRLTILHLVGMLLIVAVGSNYALFFSREKNAHPAAATALTLASLCIANLSTVIGFGLLSFSGVPVLESLGTTVAPGAFLALVFSAMLTPARA